MKRNFFSTLFTAGVLTSAGSAATINIDFGRNDAGQLSGAGWNNVSANVGDAGSNTTSILGLVDSSNVPTTIDVGIVYVTTGGGLSAGGAGSDHDLAAYPAAVASFPDSARSDSFFMGSSSGLMTMTFSSLDSNSTYEFLFYASRGNSGGSAEYTVTGANSDTVAISGILDNTTQAPTTLAITPDVNNEIVVTWETTAANSALNLMSITSTPIPEPSSAALLGLAALGLVRRRR